MKRLNAGVTKVQFKFVGVILSSMVLFAQQPAWAKSPEKGPYQSKKAPASTQENVSSSPEVGWEEQFISTNIQISEWLDRMAEVIDMFLVGGGKVTNRENETNVRIENSTFSREREDVSNTTSLSVNLRLPNVEDYFALKFTTYDESEEKRGAQQGYLKRAPRERNYGATVGLFQTLGKIRASFQPRIELQDPLKVSHSLTMESEAKYPSFEVLPKFELFAAPDRGTGVFTAVNFAFPINAKFAFSINNNLEYEEKSHDLAAGNGVSLFQGVTEHTSFVYGLMFTSINRPNYQLEGYSFSVAWNHMIYRRILDYQIVPHLDFLSKEGYHAVPGIVLNVRLNF